MKTICVGIVLIFMNCVLTQSVNQGAGIGGLVNGVNLKNTPALILAEFILVAFVVFNNQGKCEKYLYGYGKYCLLRHRRRGKILLPVYMKSFVLVCLVVLGRLAMYEGILWKKSEVNHLMTDSMLDYVPLCVLVFFQISVVQYFIELRFSASAGMLTALIYFLLTICMGSIFIEHKQYWVLWFMVPNFYMRSRMDYVFNGSCLRIGTLFLLLFLQILIFILLGVRQMKRKDIF